MTMDVASVSAPRCRGVPIPWLCLASVVVCSALVAQDALAGVHLRQLILVTTIATSHVYRVDQKTTPNSRP